MNRLKLFLGITFIFLTASGCNRSYTYYVNSFILEYGKIKDVYLKNSSSDPTIELQFTLSSRVSFLSEGEDKHIYDSLCTVYGDLGYNREIHLILNIMNVSSYYPDILSIDFVSNADFDEAHPAGTSLNDCMQFTYSSAYEYVSSGYTSENPRIQKQTKLLSEIESQDLLLLLDLPSKTFSFIKTPEIETEHTLTVKVELSDSRVLETSMDYRFSLDES